MVLFTLYAAMDNGSCHRIEYGTKRISKYMPSSNMNDKLVKWDSFLTWIHKHSNENLNLEMILPRKILRTQTSIDNGTDHVTVDITLMQSRLFCS